MLIPISITLLPFSMPTHPETMNAINKGQPADAAEEPPMEPVDNPVDEQHGVPIEDVGPRQERNRHQVIQEMERMGGEEIQV